jgi:hypothetical protein
LVKGIKKKKNFYSSQKEKSVNSERESGEKTPTLPFKSPIVERNLKSWVNSGSGVSSPIITEILEAFSIK